ncbi:Adenine DNA glycosylase [Colletotrichum orbiculare MAFF 240422]|uniref:Adenine DNA glycosylase n=1 Tax=Colletotrichum orbiculare (strain 104-T / ATCC 96160 / CBS 514.97 / LARS 414 / MAFF 240422) TaxID=1213857 RepID=A0A484G5T2_COLOR|nr:Adenine DNA glycosylase [Colletotrichum orbiculare MAFF 240422]
MTVTQRLRRQSSLAAAKRILAQVDDDDDPDHEPKGTSSRPKSRQPSRARPRSPAETDASEAADFTPDVKEEQEEQDEGHDIAEPQPKRRKVEKARKASKSDALKLHSRLFGPSGHTADEACAPPPGRVHDVTYHRPLLLDARSGRSARNSLLTWFDATSTARGMPWRKRWIDPAAHADEADLRGRLEKRAYEVWISEIMLQQTRVAVVIDYWKRWMARWPTIGDLAAADAEDVLGAWRGLGYYSRATRIHEAAKLVVADRGWRGLLPEETAVLEAKVPGIGRYTAGAIAAIVFGRAAAMVDGNVLRVLSRQMGVYGNAKTDRGVVDMLWAAADALVKEVAADGEGERSDRPGRWGQALMELGSTVCTPKPSCGECPITTTCRAYAEGVLVASGTKRKTMVEDIEDLCSVCETFEDDADGGVVPEDEDSDGGPKKKAKTKKTTGKQTTLAAFNFVSKKAEKNALAATPEKADSRTLDIIANHARKFPLKVVKKAVREEEALVCAVRRADGQLLIHRRPEKGLLAGMWEFPSHTLPAASSNTATSRKKDAQAYVAGLFGGSQKPKLRHLGELGSVPWLFSHLKLTMHVHLFEVDGPKELASSHARHRWASADEVEDESMGTGMRRCWALPARLAQSVERETLNLKVVGSTPTSGSIPVSD